jgi:hypothetical protein
MTCKEAFEHRDDFEYVGTGFVYHLSHKIHKDDYISTFSWNGYLWHCLTDENGDVSKVLECFGKDLFKSTVLWKR